MKYLILYDKSPAKLQIKVIGYLDKGYVCQGGLCYNETFGFLQAMVKRDI